MTAAESPVLKLLPVSLLVMTTSISIALFSISKRTFTGSFSGLVDHNRAIVGIVVQVSATLLATAQVYVLCSVINFAARLRVSNDFVPLSFLKLHSALSTPRLDWTPANVLYRVEYLLLDPLLLSLEVSERHDESRQSDCNDFWTPHFSATPAGALIFTYSCLRNLATPSRPYERLVRRLRLNLQLVFDEEKSIRAGSEQDDPSIDKTRNSSSPVNAHPSLLLWLLMHGFKATVRDRRDDDRTWFVKRGAEMCKSLEIHSVEELGMRIMEVVTSRMQCVPSVKAFWRAICEHELEETIQDASE